MRGTKRSVLLGVDRAEVYLDETYCNVNHVTGKTWLTADKIRYGNAGRGARACIIAAGIIKSKGKVLSGFFVEDSIKIWNSTLKRKQDNDDYHGNFDAVQLERWFDDLCKNLQKNTVVATSI
ncbi:hypothetical protein L914_20736 [Phytophthora nicotianae]|uniref:Uncharacterized protein n=1 Tax=Phytophthora nicotianae TaxID=4792 RepID=W2M8A6_PHYNI|nr:hypothetical protein L914_20736 [Phytophthora nicotianae]